MRGIPSGAAVEVGLALLAGGVSMLEITFDHAAPDGVEETLRTLSRLDRELGERLCLGAGTVLTPEEVVAAKQSGAKYIISPNFEPDVIAKTRELALLSIPGAFTPTEVVSAHKAGGDIIKLFPAGLHGPDYVKALQGPLGHIPLAAVGGVEPGNLAGFFQAGVVCVGVGSNLVDARKVRAGDFSAITAAAQAFTANLPQGMNIPGIVDTASCRNRGDAPFLIRQGG